MAMLVATWSLPVALFLFMIYTRSCFHAHMGHIYAPPVDFCCPLTTCIATRFLLVISSLHSSVVCRLGIGNLALFLGVDSPL